jgi:hypothetical protein
MGAGVCLILSVVSATPNRDALKTIADQQLVMQSTLTRFEAEFHGIRTDIRELRQEVGLSMPPTRTGKEETQRALVRAWFHLRVTFRYALVAAAGAASTWFVDWLAHNVGK